MRTTISQIAEVSGYSPATVDRVLNDRAGVRSRTRDAILQTAHELGYFGLASAYGPPEVEMDFLLPAGDNTFMLLLRKFIIEEATKYAGIKPRLHLYEDFNPEHLAERLLELQGHTDAVAIVMPDHPSIREAVNRLVIGGIHVATLVSDLPSLNKIGYVGVDNRAAGRLAGLLTGRFLRDDREHDVAVFIGFASYRGHEEREMGFRSILAQDYPHLRIRDIVQVNDDRERAYEETQRLLMNEPPAAIYNIGAGNQGIARALRDAGASPVFIAHDLTEATKGMLMDRTLDAVIDQNPRVEAREVIKLLASAVRGACEPSYPPRLQVVFRENIPVV
ncbi:LacI family DNA-binding transcriptional regulator [Halomonas huangheensis]|uniref:LacI family DNA-binding transcriptional regulator n=1 Tax=Halomonas huangheensis TaxID=1178482 RepID=UPI00040C91AC|nr:LacI family DNA-binding transcriptional regulator [Halomonas huangheensis]ALM54473.1 LacI family transcriptional regulator [Halomonas huangheensis]